MNRVPTHLCNFLSRSGCVSNNSGQVCKSWWCRGCDHFSKQCRAAVLLCSQLHMRTHQHPLGSCLETLCHLMPCSKLQVQLPSNIFLPVARILLSEVLHHNPRSTIMTTEELQELVSNKKFILQSVMFKRKSCSSWDCSE